ncbi:hypothetical protein BDZ85DRAFT_321052 [Elsinoe ampelina]|uniref:Bulb-type lectin domain-containing protein n=1 Tax=Elsinoe ampelina TaxID=302913 RepID=A0A6A6G5W0_9PEZI|nr:hypothetical protein BDZ85DRAFT_321052 [Elsinoe ampelina]
MALLLAPYNDSMRLGMGFNSYTQTICTDNAVTFTDKQVKSVENPSQVVTYSSKFVERLSDVVRTMNISYSSSIKKGTVEVAGNGNHIDEDKIKQSDTNAIVSVKVVNQTTVIDEKCTFNAIEKIEPNTAAFNDAFGDCYISGFIEGGDFNGIISMRVLDRSKTEKVTTAIKKAAKTGTNDFTLDMDAFTSSSGSLDALKDTETTISVAWMGGGQVKHPSVDWDMNSVYAAAAAFPNQVAKCPQKTWAILTKYKANRSFVEWSRGRSISVLEYDSIASYTSELFDNFMEYKQLLKLVQDTISDPTIYTPQVWKPNYIPIETRTLVAVRTALRVEMNKIVRVVDTLSKDPTSLKRILGENSIPTNAYVRAIVRDALESAVSYQIDQGYTPTAAPVAVQAQAESADAKRTESVDSEYVMPSAGPSPPTSSSAETTTLPQQQAPATQDAYTGSTTTGDALYSQNDFKSMIAPEIWTDVLPILKTTDTAPVQEKANLSTIPADLASLFPTAPDKDSPPPAPPAKVYELKILAAACGNVDVTDRVQKMVNSDQTMTLQASGIKSLVEGTSQIIEPGWTLVLSFIYQYTDGPMRCFIAKAEEASGATDTTSKYIVNHDSTQAVSTTAVIYGAKLFNDQPDLDKFQAALKANLNGPKKVRYLPSSNSFFGDPWVGTMKYSSVFYQVTEGGKMQVATGSEEKASLVLTDRRQPDTVNPQAKQPCATYSSALQPERARLYFSRAQSWTIKGGNLAPFLEFENGVQYIFKPDGDFVIQQGNNMIWHSNSGNPSRTKPENLILVWQGDGNFCAYDNGTCFWASMTNSATYLILASQAPYMEVMQLDANNNQTWSKKLA